MNTYMYITVSILITNNCILIILIILIMSAFVCINNFIELLFKSPII